MAWWHAMILGIVEGLTEYLPVSSTGHLILTAWLLGFRDDPQKWEAVFAFNIVIQIGAILAVFGLYRRRIGQMCRGLMGQDEQGRQLAIHLILAFLPAAILGPILSGSIHHYLNGPWPVVVALAAGGALMLGYAMRQRCVAKCEGTGKPSHDIDSMTWKMAVLIGLSQCVAMWPGTSRSMMTIVAALLLGVGAKDAAEFSFLLGLITLSAATGYELLKEGHCIFTQFGIMPLCLGTIVAAISAAMAVKWFVNYLNRHGLALFGWYRLILAGLIALSLLI